MIYLYFVAIILSSCVNKQYMRASYKNYQKNIYSNTIAVVDFNSKEGIKRFNRSKYKNHFFILAPHFNTQKTITSCCVASTVIILNAIYSDLNIEKPQSFALEGENFKKHYFLWTEDVFYNEKTDTIRPKHFITREKPINYNPFNQIFDGGVNIGDLVEMIKIRGIDAESFEVNSSSKQDIEKFRAFIKEKFNSDKEFIIINYHLNLLYNKAKGGHCSPVVAYDEESDSVLTIDVASFFHPWIWMNLSDLYKSMHTQTDEGLFRGYVIIKSPK